MHRRDMRAIAALMRAVRAKGNRWYHRSARPGIGLSCAEYLR